MTKKLYSVLDLRTIINLGFAFAGVFTFGYLLGDQGSRRMTDDIGPQIVGSGLLYKGAMLAVFVLWSMFALLAASIATRCFREAAATRTVLETMPVSVFPQVRAPQSWHAVEECVNSTN